ncbi:MAG TPA: SDR family oxidoreductase [Terriglobales bacterium]|nr:SDR family oxidoreductase [Terriglobales bacterium]
MALYLVTGAAGFIGSSLCRTLLEKGEKVRGLDNFSTGKRENIAPFQSKIDFRDADLLDPAALKDACAGVDYVLHQAAIPSVPKSVIDPVTSHRANIEGTFNLLLAAKDAKVKRVVYAASSSAYGETPTLPKREDMAPSPISPYAVQKLCGEQYMTSFYRVYGLETVSLRYFNVFGPYQDPTSMYSGVLAKFCTAMLKGEAPTIYGDGEQSRDFTFIENTVAGNLLAATAPAEKVAGRMFNMATGQRYTLNQTVEILRGITGYPGKVNFGEERKGDIKHSLADISAAQAAMGYKPSVGFEEGLKRTVAWYRTQLVPQNA